MSEDNLSSKYFEGKPCVKCGSTIRYASNRCCVACHCAIARKWRQANPEKRHVQKWQQNNPEKHNERNRKWRQANPEKRHVQKWQQNNPEKHRKWNENNHERSLEINRTAKIKHRAKRAQVDGSHTTQEWIDVREKYDNRCLCCGRHQSELNRVLEQDHIVPLTKNGTNWITNIQPLCHDCNGMGGKGTKTIDYREV